MKKKVVIQGVPKSSKKKVVIEGLPKADIGKRMDKNQTGTSGVSEYGNSKRRMQSAWDKDIAQYPNPIAYPVEQILGTNQYGTDDAFYQEQSNLDDTPYKQKTDLDNTFYKGQSNVNSIPYTQQIGLDNTYYSGADPYVENPKYSDSKPVKNKKGLKNKKNVNWDFSNSNFNLFPLSGGKYAQRGFNYLNQIPGQIQDAFSVFKTGKPTEKKQYPIYNPYVNAYWNYAEGGYLPQYVEAGMTDEEPQGLTDISPAYDPWKGMTFDESMETLGAELPKEPNNPMLEKSLAEYQKNKKTGSTLQKVGAVAAPIVSALGAGYNFAKQGLLDEGSNIANRKAQQAENQLYTQSVFSDAMNVTPYEEQGYGFTGRNALAADGMQIKQIGGMGEPNVEVEGEEHIQLPNGFSQEIQGKKHSEGGIPINLPQGTKIFSEKLKVPVSFLKEAIALDPENQMLKSLKLPKTGKVSYADLAKKFETKKYVDLLNSKDADAIQMTTAQLMIQQNNAKLEQLFGLQEQNKISGVHGPQVQQNAQQEQQEQEAQQAQMQGEQMEQPMMAHGGYHLPMYQNAGKTGKKIVAQELNKSGTKVRITYSDGTTELQDYVSKRPSQSAYQSTKPTWAIQNQVPATNVPATPSANKQAPKTTTKAKTAQTRPVNTAYQQPSPAVSPNQAFPPYGGINIKPVGFMTPQGPITEETGFNIQNAPTWAQRDLTEWDKAYGFEPGTIQNLAQDPETAKRYGALPGKDPIAGLYQEYMYDYHLDRLDPKQNFTPEEREKSKQALQKMWQPTGSTRYGLSKGIKGKNIDFSKAGYEDYASLRPSFIDAIGQYRYLEPNKQPAATSTTTPKIEKTPPPAPTVPTPDQVINQTYEVPGLNLGIALPNVYERLPLNYYKIEPEYIDPRYLDIQPQLNRIGRGQRAIESTLGSRGSSDMANLLQAQANRAAAEQEAYGQKYNYDRAQDAAAQQFNAQAKMNTNQYNQQSWFQQLEDPIRRRESLIGTQQMMDDQAAIENARKMQAFYGNKDYIDQTFNPFKDMTMQDLLGNLDAGKFFKQYQTDAVKQSKASKDDEEKTEVKRYGGKIKKKIKIKPKLKNSYF